MRIPGSLAIAVLSALALGACNSTDRSSSSSPTANPAATNPTVATKDKPTETIHADGVRRVTVAELQDMLAKGQAVVVDVRNQPAYDQGHIRGSKLIPTTEVAARARELPRDKTIVTYCS